jgi:hypothetical protein
MCKIDQNGTGEGGAGQAFLVSLESDNKHFVLKTVWNVVNLPRSALQTCDGHSIFTFLFADRMSQQHHNSNCHARGRPFACFWSSAIFFASHGFTWHFALISPFPAELNLALPLKGSLTSSSILSTGTHAFQRFTASSRREVH